MRYALKQVIVYSAAVVAYAGVMAADG